jgi:hypothetical protein
LALVLDSGALMAFERGDREIAALIEATRRRRDKILTSSGCVAQVWRSGGARQALLARLLRGLDEHGLGPEVSRQIGELCEATSSSEPSEPSDPINAHVAIIAGDGDLVVTSDEDDLRRLLRARRSTATVRPC